MILKLLTENKKVIFLSILMIIIILVLFIIGFFFFYSGVGKTPNYKMRQSYLSRSKYFDGKQFFNIDEYKLFTGERDKKDIETTPTRKIPVIKSSKIEKGKEGKMSLIWLGHSSILVQLGEKNILIDPVLTNYASPMSFIGIKRFSDVPIEPENVPEIDIVLLSHDHYDHLDYMTIKKIDKKVKKYIVPLGIESYLISWGVDLKKIETVDWWDKISIENIEFVFTPSQHNSGRNIFKNNSSLWGGFYFKDEFHSVYYSGDGGYNEKLVNKIVQKIGKVDLALLECGQYDSGWAMTHMFPDETVMTAKKINAKWFIPVHWGAFRLSNKNWNDSVVRSTKIAQKEKINEATPMIGEVVDYDKISKYQNKWWE